VPSVMVDDGGNNLNYINNTISCNVQSVVRGERREGDETQATHRRVEARDAAAAAANDEVSACAGN